MEYRHTKPNLLSMWMAEFWIKLWNVASVRLIVGSNATMKQPLGQKWCQFALSNHIANVKYSFWRYSLSQVYVFLRQLILLEIVLVVFSGFIKYQSCMIIKLTSSDGNLTWNLTESWPNAVSWNAYFPEPFSHINVHKVCQLQICEPETQSTQHSIYRD